MDCPICLESCEQLNKTTTCCKKVLHKECLDKCLALNGTCPMCRTVFVTIEPPPVYLVEVRHTFNRRLVATWCLVLIGGSIVFGIIGVVAYSLISKGSQN